ncbi:pyridoxal-phosphate dependent enzyme, partial [archaeon]|nr:pyridoxal-phosphate dependent enzyme [archaeon]
MSYLNSILERIGNTPLIKLQKVVEPGSANVFVKPEYLNPSGSLKDRIAIEMIRDAEEQGLLKPGYTIIEASTGNTGTALSFVGTQLGYNVEIYMPEGMTRERIRIMENYGAKVHELPLETGDEGSIAGAEVEIDTRIKCLEIEKNNSKVWWARQFSNPANTRA